MSPVRRRDPAETGTFHLPAKPPRDRVLTIVAPVAAAAVAVSVTGAAAVFVTHQTLHRAQIRDAQVLDFVRSFVIGCDRGSGSPGRTWLRHRTGNRN